MPLVRIPWQQHLSVHPDFLALLQRASTDLGRNILLGNAKSPTGEYEAAWRSRASTEYLWNGWVNKLPGFSSASNPDSGPRSHQRGVGGDLLSWSTDITAALIRAGIQVNGVPGEPWHIQLRNFAAYPIIAVNTSTAGAGVLVPITAVAAEVAMSFSIVPLAGTAGIFVTSLITGKSAHIQSMYHVSLLTRVKANAGSDVMLQAELDIVQGYLSSINPPAVVVAAPAPAPAPVDIAALVAALKPLIATPFTHLTGTLS